MEATTKQEIALIITGIMSAFLGLITAQYGVELNETVMKIMGLALYLLGILAISIGSSFMFLDEYIKKKEGKEYE